MHFLLLIPNLTQKSLPKKHHAICDLGSVLIRADFVNESTKTIHCRLDFQKGWQICCKTCLFKEKREKYTELLLIVLFAGGAFIVRRIIRCIIVNIVFDHNCTVGLLHKLMSNNYNKIIIPPMNWVKEMFLNRFLQICVVYQQNKQNSLSLKTT